jgi:hypothetical protein
LPIGAACAWNLKKWLVIATIFLFWQKLGLFFVKYLRFFVALDKKQFCSIIGSMAARLLHSLRFLSR